MIRLSTRSAITEHTSSAIRDYEIMQKLGEGSNGIAYKVRDRKNGEICVMK